MAYVVVDLVSGFFSTSTDQRLHEERRIRTIFLFPHLSMGLFKPLQVFPMLSPQCVAQAQIRIQTHFLVLVA